MMQGIMMLQRLVFFIAVSVLAGCTTGKDFNRPAPEMLWLGTTTRAEVVAVYGKPRTESTTIQSSGDAKQTGDENPLNPVRVDGAFNHLTYSFQDRSARLMGGGIKNKTLFFNFWNGTLVAYNFVSDFAEDSSNFDEAKVALLQKGQSSKSDVIAIIGSPSGRAIYPIIKGKGDEKLIYAYFYMGDGSIHKKNLELLFDASSVLVDFRMLSDATPIPEAPVTTVTTPIFIPMHK